MSSLHNIAFCSENVVSSETGKTYAQIKHCLQEKIVSTVLNKYVGQNMWMGRRYYGSEFLQTCSFSLHMMLINVLESCGLPVDYGDVFISCLYSRFDGTLSVQRILW